MLNLKLRISTALRRGVLVSMAAFAVAAAMPGVAYAGGHGGGEEGGSKCPWADDATVTVAGREMLVPQQVFDPKTPQMNIDGYELVPSVHQLVLRFFGPYGDVWESSLTRIDGGKRCIAFLVGPPVQTAEALPYNKRKAPPKSSASSSNSTLEAAAAGATRH